MTNKKPRKLLAFVVQEIEEGTGGIVYAYTNAQARREGSQQFSDGDFDSVECHRAKWADEYAPGPVPLLVLLAHGWWQECHQCGLRCYEAEDGEGNPITPVEENGRLFCGAACQEAFHTERAEIAYLKEHAVAIEAARLEARYPGVTVFPDQAHVYTVRHGGVRHVQQLHLPFTFPGCTIGNAKWGFNQTGPERTLWICNGDKKAWDEWRSHAEGGTE